MNSKYISVFASAPSESNKQAGQATLRDRVEAVHRTFLKEVQAYVQDMAPGAEVKMSFGPRGTKGVQGRPLYGHIVTGMGETKQFAFEPEDPYSAATYIAFRMGNYGS